VLEPACDFASSRDARYAGVPVDLVLVSQQRQLVVDLLMHRRPVELTSELRGTDWPRSTADCPRQFILSSLQSVQFSDRRSM